MNNPRLTRIAIALLAVISIGILTPMAQAAPHVSAATISTNVAGFRQDIGAVLTSYYASYGNRLSLAEQAQMTGLMKQIDRELASLESKTRRSAKLARQHASSAKQQEAARAAAKYFDVAYMHALTSIEQVQPILQPKLSLFEALRAKSDLDRSLQAFENLGSHLHSLAK